MLLKVIIAAVMVVAAAPRLPPDRLRAWLPAPGRDGSYWVVTEAGPARLSPDRLLVEGSNPVPHWYTVSVWELRVREYYTVWVEETNELRAVDSVQTRLRALPAMGPAGTPDRLNTLGIDYQLISVWRSSGPPKK